MSVRMIVTQRNITKREKTRRRFHHWWRTTTPENRMWHLVICGGCVGCTPIIEEMTAYVKGGDVGVR